MESAVSFSSIPWCTGIQINAASILQQYNWYRVSYISNSISGLRSEDINCNDTSDDSESIWLKSIFFSESKQNLILPFLTISLHHCPHKFCRAYSRRRDATICSLSFLSDIHAVLTVTTLSISPLLTIHSIVVPPRQKLHSSSFHHATNDAARLRFPVISWSLLSDLSVSSFVIFANKYLTINLPLQLCSAT